MCLGGGGWEKWGGGGPGGEGNGGAQYTRVASSKKPWLSYPHYVSAVLPLVDLNITGGKGLHREWG